jgi:hypothetical protein
MFSGKLADIVVSQLSNIFDTPHRFAHFEKRKRQFWRVEKKLTNLNFCFRGVFIL